MGRNGTGIREASASSYEISFTYKGSQCRERVQLRPSPANLRKVTNFLGAINTAIEAGTFDYGYTFPNSNNRFKFIERPAEGLLIEKYLEEWLERQASHLKASTLTGYKKTINNIVIPAFHGKLLSDIKKPEIKSWLSKMRCSNKRLANIQSTFRTALQEAVGDEILESNPLYGWKYQRKEEPKQEEDVDAFTKVEQAAILASCSGQEQNMFQFFFWTGLRTSELVAINWGDIDWHRGTVRINKAITQNATKPESPKTKAGRRDVKLLPPALQALERQKAFTKLKGQEVFQNPRTGERWTGDQAIRRTSWTYILTKAKVRYRRPYQTRHTYASMMLTAGESIAWLAEQMGHSDWGMLRRIYAKFIKDSIPDAGNRAVEMFFKDGGSIPEKESA